MYEFRSGLKESINSFLNYREALGYSRKSQTALLKGFDAFCARHYPDEAHLSKDMAIEWLEEQTSGLYNKSTMLRNLGKYLTAIGLESFEMPRGMYYEKKSFSAYIFNDDELRTLFLAIDSMPTVKSEPFLTAIFPVMIRLVYTCGLRPNEGRELLANNVCLKSGEILITNTKLKKDRIVVMSDDMLQLCIEYNNLRNVFAGGNDYFFPSWNGGSFTSKQINTHFQSCWKRANAESDTSSIPRVRVYDLRHRFASAALNRWLDQAEPLGVKLSYLRAYMGHSTLSETAHYIHLLPENLVKSAGIDWQVFDEVVPNPLAAGVEL